MGAGETGLADERGSTEPGASPSRSRRQFRAGTGGVLARGERWPLVARAAPGTPGPIPGGKRVRERDEEGGAPREEVRRPAPVSVARGGTGRSGQRRRVFGLRAKWKRETSRRRRRRADGGPSVPGERALPSRRPRARPSPVHGVGPTPMTQGRLRRRGGTLGGRQIADALRGTRPRPPGPAARPPRERRPRRPLGRPVETDSRSSREAEGGST